MLGGVHDGNGSVLSCSELNNNIMTLRVGA